MICPSAANPIMTKKLWESPGVRSMVRGYHCSQKQPDRIIRSSDVILRSFTGIVLNPAQPHITPRLIFRDVHGCTCPVKKCSVGCISGYSRCSAPQGPFDEDMGRRPSIPLATSYVSGSNKLVISLQDAFTVFCESLVSEKTNDSIMLSRPCSRNRVTE